MYYIGIDIGGMSIKGAIVDEKGKMYVKDSVVTQADAHYSVIVKDIVTLCNTLVEKQGISIEDIKAVGMGIPGTINDKKGVIVYSNNINFKNVPIVSEFRKYIDKPTFIGNDANVAALGEQRFGAGKGYNDVIVVTLGTGIGTGIVIDGKLFVGREGAGAEGGHICLKAGGELCSCGKRGCWEMYASASALIRQTKAAISQANSSYTTSILAQIAEEEGGVSGKTAFVAAARDDRAGKRVVSAYLKYVAEGIISLVNIFRPSLVLIGGGISNEPDETIARIQHRVNRFAYGGDMNPRVVVKKAVLKNDAGILGAVALCL